MNPANYNPVITVTQNTFQVSDMLQRAYRMAQALKHPGQGITNSESKEGLDVLNSMIDGWKIEGLMIIYTRRTVQDVQIAQESYSVGPGQDFDIEQPQKIHRAGFLLQGGTPQESELPIEIILTFERWAALVVKLVQSTIPEVLYYQATVPYGIARFWPVPSVPSQIVLYTPQLLDEFSTVDDNVEMPKGYREMLQYNLAVKIHQLYPEKPMDPTVLTMAAAYKARVQASQVTGLFIGADPAVLQESRQAKWYGGNPRAWTPY